MHRPPRPDNPRLEALLDDRDHLRIKLNLAEVAGDTHQDALQDMRDRLRALEKQIDDEWGDPNA